MVDSSLFLDPSCRFSAPPTKVNISLSFLKSCSMIQFLPFISWAMQKQGHLHKPSRVLPVSRVVGRTASLCGKSAPGSNFEQNFQFAFASCGLRWESEAHSNLRTSHTLSVFTDASPFSSRFPSPAHSPLRS